MHQGKITKLPDEKALTKRGISISPIENRELKATILFKIYCIISKIKKKNDLILEERIGSCVLFVRFFLNVLNSELASNSSQPSYQFCS